MTSSMVRRNGGQPASMATHQQPGASHGGALAAVQASREIAEVQAAMIIARQFPRDHMRANDQILNACMRPTLAEKALYTYSRGGQDVTGPSIRLAETLAQYWGNIQFGVRELEQGDGVSTVEAFAWDIETNVRDVKIFQVAHERHTRKGVTRLTDPRDIYELVANQGSRRLRACILGIIPGDVQEAAIEQCERTLAASADTSPEAQKALLERFAEFNITKNQIEKRIQRRIDAIQPAQVVDLRKVYCSLRDGMSRPEDWFEVASFQPGLQVTAAAVAPSAAVAAAAAPVATLTQQQQQQIFTALERQLTPVGRAAFTVDACGAFGVELLGEIPAEQHTALMQSIGNAGNRERWNRGCGHVDGEPVLTAEQIAELSPQAPQQVAGGEPEPLPQQRAKPAARAAAPATQAAPALVEEPGDSGDDESLQQELV
jgi:hypothetical protein